MSKISKIALTKIIEELKNLEIQKEEEKKIFANAKLQGDLSENNDYHDSKERLNFIDKRVIELKKILSESVVVVPPKNPEYISFGTKVILSDTKNKKYEYKIASDYESENKASEEIIETVSETSTMGMALMGKKIGEIVKFTTLRGEIKEYTILDIVGSNEESVFSNSEEDVLLNNPYFAVPASLV